MIKRELAKDPELKNENWDRFLPHYKSKNLSNRKKPKVVNKKKDYTPFPPPQPESKIDKQLASGEYFLNDNEKRAKKMKEKFSKKVEAEIKRQEKRSAAFIPPEETPVDNDNKKSETKGSDVDIEKFKQKIKKIQKQGFSRSEEESVVDHKQSDSTSSNPKNKRKNRNKSQKLD